MNLLSNETSPYLLQHKDNPVHWMPWGEAALARAAAEKKPILLSVGYSACHWCHVMAHESFEDAGTAAVMNQHFINVKVDREERPDIDALYQSALALMGKQGGWPLTMFLTPNGAPFWGGTYFPPQPRHGMPAFREVLRGIADAWAKESASIAHNTASLTAALHKINTVQPGSLPGRAALDKIASYFLNLIDPANGGIGGAGGGNAGPKFPSLPIISFLWDSALRTGQDSFKAAVIHSLTQMCQGGIYDHIGGGFARYTVDAEWLVPHFEKMLYDNALFIDLLSEVCRETSNPLFAARLEETVEWVLRDMRVSHGGHSAFATALDADSNGREGDYYVWTRAEVDQVLSAAAENFCSSYDVTRFGNWPEGGDGKNILNRLKNPAYGPTAEEDKLKACRVLLHAARLQRTPPGRDDKVLADMNSLMIAALAKAGDAMERPDWVAAAVSAFRFIEAQMGDGARLFHSWCAGTARHHGLLEDYANMAAAALALHHVTQEVSYLAAAERFVAMLDEDFLDATAGGYFTSPAGAADIYIRTKSAQDSAVPAGNATMVGALARLAQITGRTAFADRARQVVEAFAGDLAQHFFPLPSLLAQCARLASPLSLVIVSPLAEKGDTPFDAVLRGLSLPGLVKIVTADAESLPAAHPAFGKKAVGGQATAYVCTGTRCLAPVTTAAALEEMLRRERGAHPAANDG